MKETDWNGAAVPFGNALLVAGAFGVWAGFRSLRSLDTPLWLLFAAPGVTAFAGIFEADPDGAWLGMLVYFSLMGVGMALAARELALLKSQASQAHKPLLIVAVVLVAYFGCRIVVYAVEGPDSEILRTLFAPAVTCLLLIMLLVLVSFSMTALNNHQLISVLNERAMRDGMTGLLNRQAFMELAERELAGLQRAGLSAAVILSDLDHFKSVNDTHGHAAGDAAIRAFAAACKGTLRKTDLVARYGGEEFVILLPGADEISAEAITTEISRRLAAAPAPDGLDFPTVSYGISSTPIAGPALAQLIYTADGALYQAKAAGRNRAFIAESPLDPEAAPLST
ncbi:GGDEF domain-containing protein [Paenarthrobacter nitroguajacolicus]|uniref:GGDEF domain-containing protein n=1 Tax=Paenarthrobacter nitroguajacolicus TaxID=211146 RepID=UPI00248D0ED1|nr:GGDEF domain-containing protein [Paenarthrobacter nitroguajacolicus]